MKNLTEHTGKLVIVERKKQSHNGNPRFLLMVGDVVCCTAPDAAICYEVQNYDGKQVTATIGTHYGKATLNTIEEVEA